jgi:putative endonuclease
MLIEANAMVERSRPPSPASWPGRSTRRPHARPATDRRQAIGALGERIAGRWLRAHGWTVLAERFRSGHRDLDLVARHGSLVAFVEVKTRRGGAFGDPVESVHWRKRRELVRSAQVWIDRYGHPGEAYRFDVIGVILLRSDAPRVQLRHVADAFQVSVRP